jgi:hypothetical protein
VAICIGQKLAVIGKVLGGICHVVGDLVQHGPVMGIALRW